MSNVSRVPLHRKVWSSKTSRSYHPCLRHTPRKSTPDRSGKNQRREEGEAVLDVGGLSTRMLDGGGDSSQGNELTTQIKSAHIPWVGNWV